MSVVEPGAGGATIFERAKNILLTPSAEWQRIAPEPFDLGKLYGGYAVPLAIFAAACGAIGMGLFGVGAFGFHVRIGWTDALIGGVVQAVLSLVGLFVLGIIINALATTFASKPDQGQAHKLAVYSATASFAAAVFTLHPSLSVLSILGLYSLGLLWIGLPTMMGTPQDRRLGYFATILIAAIVAGLLIGAVNASIRGSFANVGAGALSQSSSDAAQDITVTLPGGGTINVTEAEEAARRLEAATQGAAASGGAIAAVDLTALQALMPAALPGGFNRTSVSGAAGDAMMGGMSVAEATFENGDRRIELTVTHLGAMGALGGLAGAMNIQGNQEDANGYSRVQTVNGRTVSEEVDRAANTASYTVISNGFAIAASGSGGVDVAQLRAAVDAVGVERVEQLGR